MIGMTKKKTSRGLRKRIRFEKARLRRSQNDPRPFEERLTEVLAGFGAPLTNVPKRDIEKTTNETAR